MPGSAGMEGTDPVMQLTVLAVPGCPSLAILERRLAEVLADHPGLIVSRRVIANGAEAARWGMHGSPTLLVNGHDPFAGPGAVPAYACRMYRAGNGRLEGSPGVDALRRVLAEAGVPG
jgi:hypothetical protein